MAPAPPSQACALEPAAACPAPLLQPLWDSVASNASPGELGDLFEVGSLPGFTLCARVRQAAGAGPCRILRKGEAPNGWEFSAPGGSGATGVVAFASGEREAQTLPEVAEIPAGDVEPARQESAASKRSSSKVSKAGSQEGGGDARQETDVGFTRIDDGNWHHVAVVFEDGRLRAYVDGQPDGDVTLKVHAAPGMPVVFGNATSADGADDAQGGEMKDVQVFGDALMDNQILDLCSQSLLLPTGISLQLTPKDVTDFWRLLKEGEPAKEGLRGTQAARNLVIEKLQLTREPGEELQEEVMCNFFVDLLIYISSILLSARKASVFVSVMSTILAAMRTRSQTSTCIGEPLTVAECFAEYKRLLVAHAVGSNAAGSFGVFSVPDIRQLTDFVSGTLFQHYVLYMCVLVRPTRDITRHTDAKIERPAPPPTLQTAKLVTKEEMHRLTGRPGVSVPQGPSRSMSIDQTMPAGGAGASASADPTATQLPQAEEAADPEEPDPPGEDLEAVVAHASRKAEKQLVASINEHDKTLK
eukprot:TRINITY_DN27151_c0_g1_i1.p1 TRINITY_DN27151_c0_g1~~TRINITY_DN27151_c0_g1_i1.p1  ORF type:complete len:529 (-),score=136.19 TRINITY_DN27151_c0_g1_i1:66-1652(-)